MAGGQDDRPVEADRVRADQITVARLLGVGRSTTGMVVRSPEEVGLIARGTDPGDKRRRTLRLTLAGQRVQLRRLAAPAVERLLAPLSHAERPVFLDLLARLTGAFNTTARMPLKDQAAVADPAPTPPARLATR